MHYTYFLLLSSIASSCHIPTDSMQRFVRPFSRSSSSSPISSLNHFLTKSRPEAYSAFRLVSAAQRWMGWVDSSTVAWALRRPSLTLRNLASPVAESVLLVLLVLHARKTSFSRLVIFFLFSRLHDISEIRGSKTSK